MARSVRATNNRMGSYDNSRISNDNSENYDERQQDESKFDQKSFSIPSQGFTTKNNSPGRMINH